MKHGYQERLRREEPEIYRSFREITSAGHQCQLLAMHWHGIRQAQTEEAEQFYHHFIDGLTYIARRFGTTVKALEFSPDPGVNYDGWKDGIRLGGDRARLGVQALADTSLRLYEAKAAPHLLNAESYPFAMAVEEAFHAHQAHTNLSGLKASLALQRKEGIHPLHPAYNTLPHEKEAMFVVREALRDAGFTGRRI